MFRKLRATWGGFTTEPAFAKDWIEEAGARMDLEIARRRAKRWSREYEPDNTWSVEYQPDVVLPTQVLMRANHYAEVFEK